MRYRILAVFFMICGWILAAVPVGAQDPEVSGNVKKSVHEAIDIRQTTQRAEERWRAERDRLTAEYEALQQEQQRLEETLQALRRQAAGVRERIAAKETQLADIDRISAQIQPFLQETVEKIEQQLGKGPAFLMAERRQRLDKLQRLMGESDVAVGEKFRRVMEALLIEAEYGHTIETDQQTIEVGGRSMLVNLFRLGRISVFYQTLDRKSCGHYDVGAAAWRPLPATYNRAIQTAIDIGSRRRPVELLHLPLGRIALP